MEHILASEVVHKFMNARCFTNVKSESNAQIENTLITGMKWRVFQLLQISVSKKSLSCPNS